MKNKLEELKALLDSGAITESEYQELKQKLLDENIEVDKQNEGSVTDSVESNLFEDLITKYNPNEKDLFLISFIQGKIKTGSSYFEKQKLKGKVLKILKPYKVKFMDLGILIDQIAEKEYHLQKELQDKYDTTEIESIKQSFGLKYTVPIGIGLGIFLMILILSPSGPSTCDCIDRMTDAALYGGSYETKYLKCLEKYYDEAFDYIEANDPNGKYSNYEAVIQRYWMIKCDESKSKENKEKATSHTLSDEIIVDDEDYEDMYSEEDYEEEASEEDSVLSGTYYGFQPGYFMKNKYGEDMVISGNKIPVPACEWMFIFEGENFISIEQTCKDDNSSYYYDGTYSIINDYSSEVEIECYVSDGAGSNPEISLVINKYYKEGICFGKGVGAELDIERIDPDDEDTDNYYDANSNLIGYVNVENLNFRSTPDIEANNIIGKLSSGQKVLILNTIEANTEIPKGLLKQETIVEYKRSSLKLQPGKAVDIIETVEEVDSNGRIIRMSYNCKATLSSNEYVHFNIEADLIELISSEEWSHIEIEGGTTGYVYSRFITEVTE